MFDFSNEEISKIIFPKTDLAFSRIIRSVLVTPKITVVGLGSMDTSENPKIMNMRDLGILEIEKLLVRNEAE